MFESAYYIVIMCSDAYIMMSPLKVSVYMFYRYTRPTSFKYHFFLSGVLRVNTILLLLLITNSSDISYHITSFSAIKSIQTSCYISLPVLSILKSPPIFCTQSDQRNVNDRLLVIFFFTVLN